jgi:hypothetical protein
VTDDFTSGFRAGTEKAADLILNHPFHKTNNGYKPSMKTAMAARILALLPEGAEGWRLIDSAPKTGKWVLLSWGHVTDAPFAGYCVNGKWHAAPGGETWPQGPTHWRELPPPPSKEG